MTDTATRTATAPDAEDDVRRARVAELQRRRAASARPAAATPPPTAATVADTSAATRTTPPSTAPRPARNGVARGSKVAATGLGVAAMLGLVGAMGFAARSSASPLPAPAVGAPSQVIVVLHRPDGSAAAAPSPTTSEAVATASPAAAAPNQPIVLSAQPTVRPAPASAAPSGQTSGSR